MFCVFILSFSLAVPRLKKFRAGQLFLLIFLGFATGFMFNENHHMSSERSLPGYILPTVFLMGLIYQSVKFYGTIKE